MIVQHPSNATVSYGNNHTLTCTFDTTVTCSWKHKDIPVDIQDRYWYSNAHNGKNKDCSLCITSFRKIDEGIWQCVGQNTGYGKNMKITSSFLAHLKLFKTPVINLKGKSDCLDNTGVLSDDQRLTCIAEYGTITPHLYWELDGKRVESGNVSSACDIHYCNASISWLSTNVSCLQMASSSSVKCQAYYEDVLEPLEASLKLNDNLETGVTKPEEGEELQILIYALLSVAVAVLCAVIVISFVFILKHNRRCSHSLQEDARPVIDKSSIQKIRNSLYKSHPSGQYLYRMTPDIIQVDHSQHNDPSKPHVSQLEQSSDGCGSLCAVKHYSHMRQMPLQECICNSPLPSQESTDHTCANSFMQYKKNLKYGCSLCSNLNNAAICSACYRRTPETACCGSCSTLGISHSDPRCIKPKLRMSTPRSSLESLYNDGCSQYNTDVAVRANYSEVGAESLATPSQPSGSSVSISRGYSHCPECLAQRLANCSTRSKMKDSCLALQSYDCNSATPVYDIAEDQSDVYRQERPRSTSTYTEVNDVQEQHNSLYDDCSAFEMVEMRHKRH